VNAGTFATMFGSLAALCHLFAARCSENIRRGAQANFYILTHAKAPRSDIESTQLPLSSDNEGKRLLSPREIKRNPSHEHLGLPVPTWGPRVLAFNEYLWCTFSMVMNISMSVLLQVVMFLKVATFTGTMESVAVVAVSLYFVFDLDSKVMESDSKLKPKYRRQVISQTVEREYKPMWFLRMASVSIALVRSSVPIGLLSIVLFSWRNRATGMVIGGDPFKT